MQSLNNPSASASSVAKSSAALALFAASPAAAGRGNDSGASFAQLLRETASTSATPAPSSAAPQAGAHGQAGGEISATKGHKPSDDASSARAEADDAAKPSPEGTEQDVGQDDKRAVASRGDAEQQARKTRRSTQEREQLAARQAEARQSASDRSKIDGIASGDAVAPDLVSNPGESAALDHALTDANATPLAAEVLALLQQAQHKQAPSGEAQGDEAMAVELSGKAVPHHNPSTSLDTADAQPLPGADGKPAAKGASIEAGEVRGSLLTGASSEAAASFQGELRQAQSSASPVIPGTPVAALQPKSGSAETAAADKAGIPLQAPLESPQFAPEMAARVSVLAAEGVQQAKLHLNPAEMGPVSVQIIVDGQQAQVSFVAEQSQTRSALEASLPDLASALREQGLTLAGGGVFQQSPGQSRGEREAQGSQTQATHSDLAAAPGADEGNSAMAAVAPRRTGRGVVDLYA